MEIRSAVLITYARQYLVKLKSYRLNITVPAITNLVSTLQVLLLLHSPRVQSLILPLQPLTLVTNPLKR